MARLNATLSAPISTLVCRTTAWRCSALVGVLGAGSSRRRHCCVGAGLGECLLLDGIHVIAALHLSNPANRNNAGGKDTVGRLCSAADEPHRWELHPTVAGAVEEG